MYNICNTENAAIDVEILAINYIAKNKTTLLIFAALKNDPCV